MNNDYSDMMLPLGQMLRQRYRIEEYLASGGFGNTYRVHDVHLGEDFVVKEFFCRTINGRDSQTQYVTLNNPSNTTDFNNLISKFRKEALRIRSLKGEHIVHVHDLFDANGTAYYIMDYIDGDSLSALLKRYGPMPESEVLGYLEQILDGLDETHSKCIWHLDIKPGNIMLDRNGVVKLIDFGASKLVDNVHGAITTSLAMAYTPGYAPSEQTEQRLDAIGAHTDLYALGATLYNLLTAESPPTFTELMDSGDAVFNFPASISSPMRQLVSWLMQPRRANRPQNVAQVRNYITNSCYTAPPVTYSHNTLAQTTYLDINNVSYKQKKENSRTSSISRVPLSILGICLFIIGAFLFVWNERRGPGSAISKVNKDLVEMTAPDRLEPSLEGKVVHATHKAVTHDLLKDGQFPVAGVYTKLNRDVQYLQYQERKEEKRRDKVGGGEEEITTYYYDLNWVDEPINSASFHDPQYRGVNEVQGMPKFDDQELYAQDVNFGAYKMPEMFIKQIGSAEPVNVANTADELEAMLSMGDSVTISDHDYNAYVNGMADIPENGISGNTIMYGDGANVGSVRVTFTAVPPENKVSLIAKVQGNTFAKFVASNGYNFSRLENGAKTGEEMIQSAKDENGLIKWFIRIISLTIIALSIIIGLILWHEINHKH